MRRTIVASNASGVLTEGCFGTTILVTLLHRQRTMRPFFSFQGIYGGTLRFYCSDNMDVDHDEGFGAVNVMWVLCLFP